MLMWSAPVAGRVIWRVVQVRPARATATTRANPAGATATTRPNPAGATTTRANRARATAPPSTRARPAPPRPGELTRLHTHYDRNALRPG